MGNEIISLDECCLGQIYHIIEIDGLVLKDKIRLMEIGFFKGQKIQVLKKSMLKNTLLVELSNFVFSLRRDVAKSIMVKK